MLYCTLCTLQMGTQSIACSSEVHDAYTCPASSPHARAAAPLTCIMMLPARSSTWTVCRRLAQVISTFGQYVVVDIHLHHQATLLEQPLHGHTHLRRRVNHSDACSIKGRNLVLRSALASRDDCTCVSHAAAGGGGEPSNEGHHWLGCSTRLEELGTFLLCTPTNLSDHDNTLCLGILHKPLQAVNKVSAVERVPTDSHHR
mmetsp:Transcript_14694/g.31504  ORF Transcript_14694/g.31504 Transcript_14694/m.31504 type:complete len:201 (+) Transcript_14694:189-791(+)